MKTTKKGLCDQLSIEERMYRPPNRKQRTEHLNDDIEYPKQVMDNPQLWEALETAANTGHFRISCGQLSDWRLFRNSAPHSSVLLTLTLTLFPLSRWNLQLRRWILFGIRLQILDLKWLHRMTTKTTSC